jgi:hypothetical protein
MAVKLLRTIRLDPSDCFVYDPPAAAGEWAIPGGFVFADRDPATFSGREKQAFRAGFLGLASFGWSTLAVVVEASEAERTEAVEALARHLLAHYGAPSLEAARAAAEGEIAFAAELARHPVQTLVALHRTIDDKGNISEQFRTLHARDARQAAQMPCSAGAFAIVEDDAASQPAGEEIDLAAIVAGRARNRGADGP